MASYDEIKNHSVFSIGDPNTAFSQFFVGQSHLNMLAMSPSKDVIVSNVTFEPGCRNNWHIHRGGYQILLVTNGEGWYQEEGKEARALLPGDVVITNDGVKHWHGAAESSWFQHIAITEGSPEWLEEVSDVDYGELKK